MSFHNLDDVEIALRSADLSVRDLYAVWEQRRPIPDPNKRKADLSNGGNRQIAWLQEDVSLARRFTAQALEKEEFLLVCDAAEEALRLWPETRPDQRAELVAVRMDYAAALTRLGCTLKARGLLEPCVGEDFEMPPGRRRKADILMQLGDILREESYQAAQKTERREKAEQALRFYERALRLEPDRVEALTLAATASLALAEPGSALREQMRAQARQALNLATRIDDTEGIRPRTILARAAAHVALGDTERASRAYAELAACEGVGVAQLATARYHARFLAEASGLSPDFFQAAFPPLQLIVFAGHLPDRPGARARFPLSAIEPARELLRGQLQAMNARVGLVSAAAGADLLFIEALRARGGEAHLLLPWSRAEFARTSVRPYEPSGQPPRWEPLFHRALAEAATVREIGQAYEPGSDAGWQYTMEVTAGLALRTARILRLDVQPLALWDRQPGVGVGGTGSFVEFWRRRLGREPTILDLPPAVRDVDDGRDRSRRCESSTLRQEVKSMLFADIVGYSKLSEKVIPEFVGAFLESISRLAAASKHTPHSINTWGDAVYAVFDFAHDAGCFALELTQMIRDGEESWKEKGLYWEEDSEGESASRKHPLSIRVGLHTGPVFMHYDPVVRRLGYSGAHVNRAARIEPVTAHGEVFASEEFAAMAVLGNEIRSRAAASGDVPEGAAGFDCEYAGSMPLAKGYPGRFRIYRVLPRRVFALEDLARAIHALYCAEAESEGDTPETNASLTSWERLPDDSRQSNLAQAGDIPNKLRALGYELAPGQGLAASEMRISDAQLEALASREHERWAENRRRHGWVYAPERDNARKHHPLLVPWDELNEREKEKDRDTVRNLPLLVEKARFRVRKIAGGK